MADINFWGHVTPDASGFVPSHEHQCQGCLSTHACWDADCSVDEDEETGELVGDCATCDGCSAKGFRNPVSGR